MAQKFLQDVFRRKLDMLYSARIVHSLYQQQKKGKYCDLKVIVEDQKYFLHRCVLASASTRIDEQISDLDTIRLVGVTCYGFERLLEILYSGRIPDIATIQNREFEEIVSAADALNAESVLEYCARERSDLVSKIIEQTAIAKQMSERPTISVTVTDVDESKSSTDASDRQQDCEYHGIDKLENSREPTQWTPDVDYIAADIEIGETGLDTDMKEGSSQEMEAEMIQNSLPVAKIQSTRHPIAPGMKRGVKCSICKQQFSTPSTLRAHMKKHTAEPDFRKPYRCTICGMKFGFEISLRSHLKLHSERRCVCTLCGKGFKLNKKLQLHIENSHPGDLQEISTLPTPDPDFLKSLAEDAQPGVDGQFSCPLCDRSYSRRWNVKSHILSHSRNQEATSKVNSSLSKINDTPRSFFKCPVCGMIFDRLSSIRKHASQVHRGMQVIPDVIEEIRNQGKGALNFAATEDATCWCELCGKGFKRARNLKSHMETHTGNGCECPICGRKFAQRDGLNGHLWVHGGYGGARNEAGEGIEERRVAIKK